MEFVLNIENHRQRTHDGYFPSSLCPISYSGYFWVSSEKQRFKVEKTTEVHSAKKGADSLAENTQNLFGRSAQLAQKFGVLFKKGFIRRRLSVLQLI